MVTSRSGCAIARPWPGMVIGGQYTSSHRHRCFGASKFSCDGFNLVTRDAAPARQVAEICVGAKSSEHRRAVGQLRTVVGVSEPFIEDHLDHSQ